MPRAKKPATIDTRERIKRVAMDLFGKHDPDHISVREIARAADQKNVSVLNYYFGSKEELLRELILDVATATDIDRRRCIEEIEASGGPHAIREVVAIALRRPHAAFTPEELAGPTGAFIDMMLAKKADLLFETISPELSPGTRACLDHLRRMLPGLPEPILSQRLRLAILLGFVTLSSRRDAVRHPHLWPDHWTEELAHQNLIDTTVGLLNEQISRQTMDLLESKAGTQSPAS